MKKGRVQKCKGNRTNMWWKRSHIQRLNRIVYRYICNANEFKEIENELNISLKRFWYWDSKMLHKITERIPKEVTALTLKNSLGQ